MPIYTLKHPKFRRRGFAFGPFLAIGLGLWLLFGIPFTDAVLYPDMDLDISSISFVNDHHVSLYEKRRGRELERLRELRRKELEAEYEAEYEAEIENGGKEARNADGGMNEEDGTDANTSGTGAEAVDPPSDPA